MFFLTPILMSLVLSQAQAASAFAEVPISNAPPLLFCRGEQRLLTFPGLLRYSLGSEIVRATPPGSLAVLPESERKHTILFKALETGESDLWVWKNDGRIERRAVRVSLCRPSPTAASSIEPALTRLQEAEVYYSGTSAILRGTIKTREEAARVKALTLAFAGKVRDETRPSESLLKSELEDVLQWISESGSTLGARIAGGEVQIHGQIEDLQIRRSLEKEISSRFLFATSAISGLPDDSPTVYFRVFLLEMRKDRFGSLGISWPGSSPNAFRVTTAPIPRFEDLLKLDLALETMEEEGSLKVLSRPELAVRAPGEAELFAGGELPIHTQGRYFSNVAWKPYGLTLKLKITHFTDAQVRLDIFTEVSQLDIALSSSAIPGIRANRMKTQVDARFGSPLLLSGLLQEKDRETARGLPLLRSLPVLGALFGSKDYLQDKSELVAILLPLRTPPAAPDVSPEVLSEKPQNKPSLHPPAKLEKRKRIHMPYPLQNGARKGLKKRALRR